MSSLLLSIIKYNSYTGEFMSWTNSLISIYLKSFLYLSSFKDNLFVHIFSTPHAKRLKEVLSLDFEALRDLAGYPWIGERIDTRHYFLYYLVTHFRKILSNLAQIKPCKNIFLEVKF